MDEDIGENSDCDQPNRDDQPNRGDRPNRPDDPDRGEDMMFPESFRKLMRVIFGPFNRR